MAIYKVTITTERANFCKVFTDYDQAIKETDAFLFDNELNDGCSLGSDEDFLALNMVLADIFDDAMNIDNHAEWEDITEAVQHEVIDNIYRIDLNDEEWISLADKVGVNVYDIVA